MRLLVDMDGVIADFEKGFLEKWREEYPHEFFVLLEDRKEFYPKNDYPVRLRSAVEEIYLAPGFYLSLPPIDGSLEALTEIKDKGYEVGICTSPLTKYENCILEKYQWVDKYLGIDWVKRMIVTKDKTLIKADILIEDKPEIKGDDEPSWEHILYDQPYNRQVKSKRRLTWQNWREVLEM